MQRSPRSTLALLALAFACLGCKQSSSILFVTVGAPVSVKAVQLGVTVLFPGNPPGENISVPSMKLPDGEPINWPASFTISVDRSYLPPVMISINAYDSSNSIVGYGTTVMQHIYIGGQTDIPVMLMEGLPPDTGDGGAGGAGGSQDAGTAGAGTAGAGAGGGGAGGSAGAGGGGGAPGKDGGGDAEDATGLDAASE
jgi:hypothetical protein